MKKTTTAYLKIAALLAAGLSLLFFHELVLAAGSKDLKGIAENVSEQVKSVASLLIIVAYVAGVGFALGGIIQFKAHKDNPTQVPLSKPIVFLVVGACLLFLPSIIKSSGETIFGGDQESGGKFEGVIE